MIDCPTCTANEVYVLDQLQSHGVTDRTALAVIMGNIKQESNFVPNICEGGWRVPYFSCNVGGYGLIQWTSANRYYNLGKFCKKTGCNPSTLSGQTAYMIQELKDRKELPLFQKINRTFSQYMGVAYRWLGWGIHGNRTHYAYNYLNRFS